MFKKRESETENISRRKENQKGGAKTKGEQGNVTPNIDTRRELAIYNGLTITVAG